MAFGITLLYSDLAWLLDEHTYSSSDVVADRAVARRGDGDPWYGNVFVTAGTSNPELAPLHHIALTPLYTYPSTNSINAGGVLVGYTAIGWNDAAETDQNYTWAPTWDTTDAIGTVGSFGGSAAAGYTAEYTAGVTPGFDNITVITIKI